MPEQARTIELKNLLPNGHDSFGLRADQLISVSDIEQEVADIAVLDGVGFSLDPEFACGLDG